MKKRILCALLAATMVLTAAACNGEKKADTTANTTAGGTETTKDGDTTPAATDAPAAEQGKVFNIRVWNDEWQGFFKQYIEGTKAISDNGTPDDTSDDIFYDKAIGVPEGLTINWDVTPSDEGAYQSKLDEALLAQSGAAADDKVDLFLAEADYIKKYVNADVTMDVASIGYKTVDTMYQYTIDACTDANGKVKGVSFQACPAGVIYRRSIAKDVLGTDDPTEVQAAISDWTKFNEVAAKAKAKGYYMTASYVETYRTFSNNAATAWVDASNNLVVDQAMKDYIAQAKDYLTNGYTLPAAVWSDEKTAQMGKDGKALCFFGPAWYFNFCMGPAHEQAMGDWGLVEGPSKYFWGGTWLLAATGSDNTEFIKTIFDAFTQNDDIATKLVEVNSQFPNNSKINEQFAADPDYGSEFLGGQNDMALFCDLVKGITFENKSIYDQMLNEKLPSVFLDYFTGTIDEATAYSNFYKYVNETYTAIVTPAA